MRKAVVFALLLAIAAIASSCGEPPEAERVYEVRGTIVGRTPQSNELIVAHEKIGDWMEAMTMPFPVREAKVEELPPDGSPIVATVHVTEKRYWLTGVEPAPR
jgi:hypothetical protein